MKRAVSLLLLCAVLCTVLVPAAHAEPTPERQTIYLDVGDTYTIETGRTIGTDEMLYANWYSSAPSKLEIVGQNFGKDTSDVRALASSAGETITVRVEFAENLGYPWLEPVKGVFVYLFVVRGQAPQSISLPPSAELTDTASLQLTPEFTPEDAETACQWSSSAPSVATVSDTGLVRGVSRGTAVITAETVNGLTARCTVTVKPANMCGDDLEWSLEDGVLTISGTGAMYDYGPDEAPWTTYNGEITRIVLTEGVTRIGTSAFSSCAASEAELPESLLEIGDEAFFGCQNLRHISLPSGVRAIDGDPFSGDALERITVSAGNPYFSSFGGVLFDKDMTTLVRYPSGREGSHYCVPASVDRILYAAFYRTALQTLYVPETVSEIEYFGLSTSGLTVYGAQGSAAEQAVNDYVSYGLTMYFVDLSGADYTMVRVGSARGSTGGTVSVPVILSGNTGFANLNIQISYDPSRLSLRSVRGESLGALYTEGPGTDAGLYNMSWDSAENITYNGTIAVLEFEVTDLSGRTPIGVSFYTGLDGSYTDGYDVNYTAAYEPLELHYMSGDVASDDAFGTMTVQALSTEGPLRFSVRLTSETELDGVIAAAVYDSGGKLWAVQLREAAERVEFEFPQPPAGGRLRVLWLESPESLKPFIHAEELEL